jgi:hypothetical protein
MRALTMSASIVIGVDADSFVSFEILVHFNKVAFVDGGHNRYPGWSPKLHVRSGNQMRGRCIIVRFHVIDPGLTCIYINSVL